MPKFRLHPAAVPASVPADVRLQIVSHCAKPPDGDGWLHEIKHDGHRLVAIVTGRESLKLLSRNGIDRTRLFRDPFRTLAAAGHPIVMDGEIAVPDERGVTHLDALTDALGSRRSERLAYFAFHIYPDIRAYFASKMPSRRCHRREHGGFWQSLTGSRARASRRSLRQAPRWVSSEVSRSISC